MHSSAVDPVLHLASVCSHLQESDSVSLGWNVESHHSLVNQHVKTAVILDPHGACCSFNIYAALSHYHVLPGVDLILHVITQ